LSEHFTVVNYDRAAAAKARLAYAVEREVEDIEALIDAVAVQPSRSAALLARFCSRRGKQARRKARSSFYTNASSSTPAVADARRFHDSDYKLVSAGQRNDAVKLFFARGMGIPNFVNRWAPLPHRHY